jgi:hypothetical protein
LVIQALTTVGSIHAVKVATGLKTEVSTSSNHSRIQYFIHEKRVMPEFLILFLLKWTCIETPYTLIPD